MSTRRKGEGVQARRFAGILGLALAGLSAWSWSRGHPGRAGTLAGLAAAVVVLAAVAPASWLRLFRLWMILAEGLSWVMTRVILAVFFYAVLTPVGFMMRRVGKAGLDLRWKDGKPSYWIDRVEAERTRERYRKQY